jgi:hypothetical protein
MYTFRATGDGTHDDHATTGTVRAHGDRLRIDIDREQSDDDHYMLLTGNGDQMLLVKPDDREVTKINAKSFEQIIGTSLRSVSSIVKFHVLNHRISYAKIGSGEKILGYDTDQIRITDHFDVRTVALGFDGGTDRYTVVTDYWVSPGLDLGRNPLLTLLEHAGTALAQVDASFVQEEATVRARALSGTPLRTVVHESKIDDKVIEHTNTHVIDITSVHVGPQKADLFEIPSNYRVKAAGSFSW